MLESTSGELTAMLVIIIEENWGRLVTNWTNIQICFALGRAQLNVARRLMSERAVLNLLISLT